mgnify:CR=1 FL=1
MIGHQPLRELERVGKAVPGLAHRVGAEWRGAHVGGRAAQVERTGRCCRRFDSGTHAWCGHATVMVLVSSASGPRVSGCTRAPLNFRPYPVLERATVQTHKKQTNKRNTHKQTPGGAVRLAYGAMRLFSFLYCFLRAAAPQKGDSSLAQREARAEFFSPYPLAIEAGGREKKTLL